MARPVDPNLRFDEKTRRAYEAWLDGDSRHLLRMAIGFGMVAYSINHIGDYSFPGADIDALFLARMSVVCVLLAMLALMVLRRNVSVSVIAILISVAASVSNTIIGQFMLNDPGFWLTTAQAVTALFLTMVVLRFRDLAIVAAMLALVPMALTSLIGGSWRLNVPEVAFLGTTALGMVFIGHFVELGRRTIFKLSSDLRYTATHDTLTGVYNRSRVLEALQSEVRENARRSGPVSVLCMDIDHFKRINDTYGHSAGDEVLKAMTRCLTGRIRNRDFLGRIGGEEFLIVLPETGLDEAGSTAERVRGAIEEMTVQWQDQTITCTISIGVARLGESDDAAMLLSRADHALYRAKGNGRNRVETEVALGEAGGSLLDGPAVGAGALAMPELATVRVGRRG